MIRQRRILSLGERSGSDLGGCPGLGSGAEGHEAWSGRSLEQRASRRLGAEARSRSVVTEEHSRDHAGAFVSLKPNCKDQVGTTKLRLHLRNYERFLEPVCSFDQKQF